MPNLQSNVRSDARIFVIDDEPIITSVLEAYLANVGYNNTHIFNDSVEAIETLEKTGADLIVTDVNMPELGGRFLAKLIRKDPRFQLTPIIVVTSEGTPESIQSLEQFNICQVLTKPIDGQEFVTKVNIAIENYRDEIERQKNEQSAARQLTMEKTLRSEQSVRALFNREKTTT